MTMPAGSLMMAYFTLLTACAATAHWRRLADDHRQHAWLGLTVALVLMWNMPAKIGAIDLHLAGASIAALMFGVRLGAISLAVALGVSVITRHASGPEWALQGITFTLLPAFLTVAMQRLVQARLPHHIFVYLFVSGFGATLLANSLSVLMFTWTFSLNWADHSFNAATLPEDYLAYRLLLCWGEAMLTGMLVAIFVVYRPQWVSSFRDDIYLQRSVGK